MRLKKSSALLRIGGKFVLIFVAAYALLILPGSILMRPYASGFISVVNAGVRASDFETDMNLVLLREGSKHDITVRFCPRREHRHRKGQVLFEDGSSAPIKVAGIDSRRVAYQLAAFTLALFLATPVSWKKRLKGALLGLTLVHLYIALFAAFVVMKKIGFLDPTGRGANAKVDGGEELTLLTRVLSGVYDVVAEPPMTFVAPILAWLAVAWKWIGDAVVED